jgi:uncharacterized membrane protein
VTDFLLWYLLITLLGWLSFPLAFRLLPGLADRGYALARTLGLLIWAYLFWLLAVLGLVSNNLGGILLALGVLAAIGVRLARRGGLDELTGWLRRRSGYVLTVEALFLLAFAAMALVRAANPEISGTEKPMELAFINAIYHSPAFPPHDPWLSGYAISYYYFGYVMIAMLARVCGTASGVAFNLGVALVFALGVVGVYGVVYNLLMRRSAKSAGANAALAFFAPLFALLAGNLEGVLEVIHARGWFMRIQTDGSMTSAFWRWLDLRELSAAPAFPLTFEPTRYLWWWRASRVVQDYDAAGTWKEVIDEFPAFSFVLGDLHPHVLALPFAFLAISLALNLANGGAAGQMRWPRQAVDLRARSWAAVILFAGGVILALLGSLNNRLAWSAAGLIALGAGSLWLAGLSTALRQYGWQSFTRPGLEIQVLGPQLEISPGAFLLAALSLGGLGFLNTWDFPFYTALFAGVYAALRWQRRSAAGVSFPGDFFGAALLLTLAGILLYLPFYVSFSSQAGGVLPNLIYPTRGAHLWVMFAVLWLPIFAFLLYSLVKGERRWGAAAAWVWGGLFLLWGTSLLLAFGIIAIPAAGGYYLSSIGAVQGGGLFQEALARRLSASGGWLTLGILATFTLALLFGYARRSAAKGERSERESLPSSVFVLLLILLGALLVIGPEFFFLRDLFGWRINTVFKFYYQAWLLWSVAAAYSAAALLRSLRGVWSVLYSLLLSAALLGGLTYSVLALNTKTNGFQPAGGWTLDGAAHLASGSPDETAAAAWLASAPPGVIAEAVGGSYTIYGRVAALSGLPTVLGWDFHEMQWRGGSEEMGSRRADIQQLYCTRDWQEAQAILQQYDIRYVVVGEPERSAYTAEVCPGGLNEGKFQRALQTVFQQGRMTIYALR